MKMCLGDQQWNTPLLYLYDICVFTVSINKMLDHSKMMLKWLKDFNLKIKPKKCYFFQCSTVFLGYVISVDGLSTHQEKLNKV